MPPSLPVLPPLPLSSPSCLAVYTLVNGNFSTSFFSGHIPR